MISLNKIQLLNFRNFKKIELDFAAGVNAIIGPNALGKTTLLEAIHILSTGRSFRTTRLIEAIKKGEKGFSLRAEFMKDGVEQSLKINYTPDSKEIRHNSTNYTSFTPLLGLMPSVIYSPFDIDLIHGSPSERRRFINIFIAQANPLYVYYLTRYTKALEQRNSLLKQKQIHQIEIWEEELINSATHLKSFRANFIEMLNVSAKEMFKNLSDNKEALELIYEPSTISQAIFDKNRTKEVILGHTLAGPHRDDFDIKINDLVARNYASEGQKRCIIAAMKLAESKLIDPSILLIDDFGVHMDAKRKKKFEVELLSRPQLFLTSPFDLDEIKDARSHYLTKLSTEALSTLQ
jgi:DNA replication and repair protein RecF